MTLDESEAPDSIRRRVLRTLLEAGAGDHAWYYRLTACDGRPQMEARLLVPDNLPGFAEAASASVSSLLAARDTRRPEARELCNFLADAAIIERSSFVRSEAFQTVFRPYHLAHQQRLLVYHGDEFIAWVGLLRGGARRFCRADQDRLQPLVGPVIAALTAAQRRATASVPEEAGDIVADAYGHIENASAVGRRWLEQDGFREAVRRAVRAWDLDRMAAPRSAILLQRAEARFVRLDGRTVRYLVQLRRPSPVRLATSCAATGMGVGPARLAAASERWQLTRRQTEVLDLLVRGRANKEISAELGCTPKTVELHVTALLRKSGLTSRTELMAHVLGAC
ncbi:MAG: helix-turn-helix transcriptional regulator [Myxococcota bacterium]